MRMRLKLPSLKLPVCVAHGVVEPEISISSVLPILARVPTGSSDHSIPAVVRFSPAAPGVIGCPSDCSRSMTSRPKRHTAR